MPPVLSCLLASHVLLIPGQAAALCRFPEGATSSPRRVAETLLASANRVGLAVVEQREDLRSSRPEILRIVYSFKGEPGIVRMASPTVTGAVTLTNSDSSFGMAEGTIVLAPVRNGSRGAIVSECSVQLLTAVPPAELLQELFAMSNRQHRRK